MEHKIKIISIIEDQIEIGQALKTYINRQTTYCCDVVYPNAKEAIAAIPSCKPDIIICDIGLPDISGVECMKILLPKVPSTKFIMFTIFDTDMLLFDALKAGASGYILKNDELNEITNAINLVLEGGGAMSPEIAKKVIKSFQKEKSKSFVEILTNHQLNILKLVSEGLLNKEISEILNINEGTVKVQISNIYKKLQVNNRVEASNLYRNLT